MGTRGAAQRYRCRFARCRPSPAAAPVPRWAGSAGRVAGRAGQLCGAGGRSLRAAWRCSAVAFSSRCCPAVSTAGAGVSWAVARCPAGPVRVPRRAARSGAGCSSPPAVRGRGLGAARGLLRSVWDRHEAAQRSAGSGGWRK